MARNRIVGKNKRKGSNLATGRNYYYETNACLFINGLFVETEEFTQYNNCNDTHKIFGKAVIKLTSKDEYFVTEEGLQELKNELEDLSVNVRPEVINAIKEARALGDLSENADYDAARNEQAEIEARIKKLEVIIDNAEISEED